jgi:hypothetical protein
VNQQISKLRLIWDSSALIDAVLAPDDSPYSDLFELGEAGAVDMRIRPDVSRECEAILRPFGDEMVTLLAIILHEADFVTTSMPSSEMVDYCENLTGYRNDARILAAAEECRADLLVTHDKQHFLGNPLICPPDTYCRARTAGEALLWCLQRLVADGEAG